MFNYFLEHGKLKLHGVIIALLAAVFMLIFAACSNNTGGNSTKTDNNGSEPTTTEIEPAIDKETPATKKHVGLWGEKLGEKDYPVLSLSIGAGVSENINYNFNCAFYITEDGTASNNIDGFETITVENVRSVLHNVYTDNYYFLKNDNTLWVWVYDSKNRDPDTQSIVKILDDAAFIYRHENTRNGSDYAITHNGRFFRLSGLEAVQQDLPDGCTAGVASLPVFGYNYYIMQDGTLWNSEELLLGDVIDMMYDSDKNTYILRSDYVLYRINKDYTQLNEIKQNIVSIDSGYALSADGTLFGDFNKGNGTVITENVAEFYPYSSINGPAYVTTDNVLYVAFSKAGGVQPQANDVVEVWAQPYRPGAVDIWFLKSDGTLHSAVYDEQIATGVLAN